MLSHPVFSDYWSSIGLLILPSHATFWQRLNNRVHQQDDQEAKEALSGQGISWLSPSSEEFAEWDNLASSARTALVKDGYVSEPLYDRVVSILKKIRAGE